MFSKIEKILKRETLRIIIVDDKGAVKVVHTEVMHGGSDDSYTTSTHVKTGDDTPIGLYVTLLVLAACAVIAAVVLAKKKSKKD